VVGDRVMVSKKVPLHSEIVTVIFETVVTGTVTVTVRSKMPLQRLDIPGKFVKPEYKHGI
jgi:hypothetical protein